MRTLIFEGIATSGKSTVTSKLVKSLQHKMSIELATEKHTHEPIMAERDTLHTLFFKNLIHRLTLNNPDLLIFDRLYITQAYRAKRSLKEYSSVENALAPYSPHTIILKIDEAAIADRIEATSKHRGQEWFETYWKSKGDSFEEIAKHYIEQQRSLLQLVKQSKLPHTVFNTTNHNYDAITEDILKMIS